MLCDTEGSALLRDRDQWSDGSSPGKQAPHSVSPYKDLLFVYFSWRTHLLQSLHLKGEKPEPGGAIPPPKTPSRNYDSFPARPSVVPHNLMVRAPLWSRDLPLIMLITMQSCTTRSGSPSLCFFICETDRIIFTA